MQINYWRFLLVINILGIGPGDLGLMSIKSKEIIEKSNILIGGTRNLLPFKNLNKELFYIKSSMKEVLDFINLNSNKEIAILASGDPMLYGIGKYLSENLDSEINIVSGISSMQYIFSKLKIPMNDIYISSTHNKRPDFDFLLQHKKIVMVTDKEVGPYQIAKEIKNRNLKRTIIIGENLSYEDEKITILNSNEVKDIEYNLNVVVILDE